MTLTLSARSGLRKRLLANAFRTAPWVVARICLTWLFMFPWFLLMLVFSAFKAGRWSHVKTCKDFMTRHELAFPDIDPESIRIESLSGGVSNSNHFWRCRRTNGEPVTYFVKVFVAIGTFWARNLSLVSPFPQVYGVSSRERFTVDITCRVLLSERGIAVPRLIAFDAVHQVLVTEFLEGDNVDHMLQEAGHKETLSEEIKTVIAQCGTGLGSIHKHGYSLIDTQPINCIWSSKEKQVYFTDLEFCTQRDHRLWDAGFFICFLSIRMSEALKAEARSIFIRSYETASGIQLKKLNEVSNRLKDYIPVFQTILDVRQFKPEELLGELVNPAV